MYEWWWLVRSCLELINQTINSWLYFHNNICWRWFFSFFFLSNLLIVVGFLVEIYLCTELMLRIREPNHNHTRAELCHYCEQVSWNWSMSMAEWFECVHKTYLYRSISADKAPVGMQLLSKSNDKINHTKIGVIIAKLMIIYQMAWWNIRINFS